MKKSLFYKLMGGVALCVVMTLALTGCGSSSDGEATKSYNVTGNIWGQGVNALDIIAKEAEYTQESVGNKFKIYNDNFTADTQASNFQSMISSGTDGMMVFGSVPTLYSSLSKNCEKAKTPFVFFDQIPTDKKVIKTLNNNKYYLGSVGTDNYAAGENVAKAMLKNGVKTAFTLGGAVGDVVHDARLSGFKDAFTKGGGKLLASGHCDSPSDAATKGDDLIAAHKDADAIYALTGDYSIGVLTAESNHKVDIPVYQSDTTTESIKYIKNGKIVYADGGSKISTTLAGLLLANYLQGNEIRDKSGNAPYFGTIVPFKVTKDIADKYQKKFLEDHPMSKDALKKFVGKDVSYKTFVDFIDNYSFDSVSK